MGFNPDEEYTVVEPQVQPDMETIDFEPTASGVEITPAEEPEDKTVPLLNNEQVIKDVKDTNINIDDFEKSLSYFNPDPYKEEPSFLEYVGENLTGVRVGAEKTLANLAGTVDRFFGEVVGDVGSVIGYFGGESVGESMKSYEQSATDRATNIRNNFGKKEEEFKQNFKEEFGEDATEWGTTVGEIGVSMISPQRALGKMFVAELVHSAARHDVFNEDIPLTSKIGRMALDVGLPVALAGYIQRIAPIRTELTTSFGNQFANAPKSEQSRIIDAVEAAERHGIEILDDDAAETVIKSIFNGTIKTREEVATMVFKHLDSEAGRSKQAYESLYQAANEAGMKSETVTQGNLIKSLMNSAKKVEGFTFGAKNELAAVLKNAKLFGKKELTIADMSVLRKALSKESVDGKYPNITSAVLDNLDKIMGEVADASGIDKNLYNNANKAFQEHLLQFKGKAGKAGKSGFQKSEVGTKIGAVVDAGEDALPVDKLFGKKLTNIPMAKRLAKTMSKEERRDVVIDILTKGVKESIETPAGSKKLANYITNPDNVHPEVIKVMLGEQAGKELLGDFKLLSMINNASDEVLNTTLAHDLRLMLAAPLVAPFHGLKAGSMTIAGARGVAKKAGNLFGEDTDKMITRVRKLKSSPLKNRLLHRLLRPVKATAQSIPESAGEESEEVDNKTLLRELGGL